MLALVAVSIILNFTRGVWLGCFLAGIYLLARWRPKWLWALPILLALAYVGAPSLVRERLHLAMHPTQEPALSIRLEMWRVALRMIRAHPWVGVGPNNIEEVYDLYLPPGKTPEVGYHSHFHNDFLQFGAERGLPCLASWVWLMAALGWYTWKLRRQLSIAKVDRRRVSGRLGGLPGGRLLRIQLWHLAGPHGVSLRHLHALYSREGRSFRQRDGENWGYASHCSELLTADPNVFLSELRFSRYTISEMNPKQQMLRSSIVVAFFNLLGGLSGILVETSIAANLGLSVRSDTFYVAYTIPYIITNLLTATGQFSLVPFFASLESSQDEKELWRGFSYVANILFLGLGAIALVGVVARPWIIHGIAPGFTHQEVAVATQLSRWLFLIIIPAGIGEVLRSFLLSRHYFALSTASGFIRNVTSIVVILLGFHRYGPQSIFLGYLAGYLLQLVVLGVPILASFRPRYFPDA